MRSSANRMLGLTVAVVAVVAIAVALLTASRTPSALDPASPGGVVQQYLTAVFEHRNDDAARFLDPAGSCNADDLDRSGVDNNARVDLVDTWTEGDTARVSVSIEHSSGDPFGGGWTEEKTLRLSRISGTWKITGVPWPMYDCDLVAVK